MNKTEWYKDIDFWENFSPVMFDEAHWSEAPLVADAVTRLSRFNLYGETSSSAWREPLKSPPKILDLCCGVGRVSCEFAHMGFSVTGVDITECFLNAAKEDAKYEDLDIEFIHCDSREFIRKNCFDTAVNLYISFGYFAERKDDLKVCRNVYESLKKDGSFIIETLGKEIAVRDFTEAEWFERDDYTVLTEYEPVDSWTFLKNRWIILKDGKKVEKIFTKRLYSASELRELLHEAGFKSVEIYGDWDESPYNQNAVKLIAAGRK